MNLERRNVPFELRASSEDGSEFSGYGSTFFKIDDYGSMFARTAFDDTLPFFLSKGFIGGLDHNWAQPIGKPVKATTDSHGLFIDARISKTAHGLDVRELIKDKVISQLSIGFMTLGYEWLDTQSEVEAYWKTNGYTPDDEDLTRARYGAMVKTKTRLYEVSPVTIPANTDCVITDVRATSAGAGDRVLALLGDNADAVALLEHADIDTATRTSILRLRSICNSLLDKSASGPAATGGTTGAGLGIARRRAKANLVALEADLVMNRTLR